MNKPRQLRSNLWTALGIALGTALTAALLAVPAAADSQARIVRLSDVHGTVQINKNSGLGFENAFANLPITQGTELRTRDNGRAEIEFEDGSTLRLTPNATVEFSIMGLSDAGKRITVVNLVQGRAYVYWLGKSGDAFTLNFSQEKVELKQAAHFRAEASSTTAEIASFKNDLEVVGPSDTVRVGKGKMVGFDVNSGDTATAATRFEQDAYDQWDQQAIDYHDQYSKNNSAPNGYGESDLSYYGAYSNLPGYGMLWQPYFAGASWNPYMDGAWSWYPGMGYMWASAYPWGWLPYNYGNWMFVPGFGWGWQPGSGTGWRGGIHYVGAVAGFSPPTAPKGTVGLVTVGKGGPVMAAPVAERMMVKSGSAGFGIPRGSYGNLQHVNSQVAKTGSVELHAAPRMEASSWLSSQDYGSGRSRGGSSGSSSPSGHGSASSGHSSGGGGASGHH